jgi:hypothetical protein
VCELRFETGTFRIQSRNIHYAIQIGYLPVGFLATQLCQSVTISFVVIVSFYPHARRSIGCPYFCFCKPHSVGKLAFAVRVSSLTSPHSVVPLLPRIRTSVNTRRQSSDWWCVRILAGEDSRGVNTGASRPRAQMR